MVLTKFIQQGRLDLKLKNISQKTNPSQLTHGIQLSLAILTISNGSLGLVNMSIATIITTYNRFQRECHLIKSFGPVHALGEVTAPSS